DMTYLPTWQGFLYLAVVLDVFSRRVVGWAMAEHLRTELVLDALEMAVWNRRPAPGLVHHSDHGCQYTSLAFGRRCRQSGIALSSGARKKGAPHAPAISRSRSQKSVGSFSASSGRRRGRPTPSLPGPVGAATIRRSRNAATNVAA